MPSYMGCSQFLSSVIKWKMGGTEVAKFGPSPSLTSVHMPCINMMKQAATKKAALGGPSSHETLPLREKIKFYVLLLAAASYPA